MTTAYEQQIFVVICEWYANLPETTLSENKLRVLDNSMDGKSTFFFKWWDFEYKLEAWSQLIVTAYS